MFQNALPNGIRFYLPEFLGPVHLPTVLPYVAILAIIGFVLAIVPGLIYIERVVMALMQDRTGPNRVGPRGLLQTLADGVKIFFKEEILPKSVDVRIYYLAPIITLIPALTAGAVLPIQMFYFIKGAHVNLPSLSLVDANGAAFNFVLGEGSLLAVPFTVGNVNIGLLYVLAMSSLQAYGVVLAGWSSNNKYSLLGGLRASAQLISYELAMGLSLLCVIILAGSLQLDKIVEAQNILPFGIEGLPSILKGSVFSWFWLGSLGIPVIIYTIAMIAETNRAPFDLPEAEAELIAGFMTEYTSMKYAIFFMGEYATMLTVSGLNAAVFWGGYLPPLNIAPFTLVPGFVWFILKIMGGIWLYVWLRSTLPRLRYDSLMDLGWKKLLPLALFWLFLLAGFTLVRELGTEAKPTASVASEIRTVSH